MLGLRDIKVWRGCSIHQSGYTKGAGATLFAVDEETLLNSSIGRLQGMERRQRGQTEYADGQCICVWEGGLRGATQKYSRSQSA